MLAIIGYLNSLDKMSYKCRDSDKKTSGLFHFCLILIKYCTVMHSKQTSQIPFSEPWQASNMERFLKIVNGRKSLNIFTKCCILDVWQDMNTPQIFSRILFESFLIFRVYYEKKCKRKNVNKGEKARIISTLIKKIF